MLGKAYVCMYLANVVTTRPLYEYECQFAICESCFWCATIFHKAAVKQDHEEYTIETSSNFQICPACKNKSISLTLLAKNEMYRISMESKRGLEIEFSKHRR